MAKLRLTESMREGIIGRVLSATFEKKTKSLETALKRSGDALYKAAMGKFLRHVEALPEGFFNQYGSFYSNRYGLPGRIETTKNVRIPACGVDEMIKSLPADHAVVVGYVAAYNAIKTMSTAREALRQQLRANIRGCRTLEDLLEVWPEGKKYIPKDIAAERTLPVVQFSTVNHMIATAQGKPVETPATIAL